jgi:hypothetical protein
VRLNGTSLRPACCLRTIHRKSCANDPRIVEIATKLVHGNLSERDVGMSLYAVGQVNTKHFVIAMGMLFP